MGVQFQQPDTGILYCIPETGCDLNQLLKVYTFFDRTAVPDYETVAGCIHRAVRAGAIDFLTAGRYRLTPEWYARVHKWDRTEPVGELAAIELADEWDSTVWPVVFDAGYTLPKDEYLRAAEQTRAHHDELFGRRAR